MIKGYGLEKHEISEFKSINQDYQKNEIKLAVNNNFLAATPGFLLDILFLIFFFAIGQQIISGNKAFSVGTLIQMGIYGLSLFETTYGLTQMIAASQRAVVSWQRIREIFAQKPTISDTSDNINEFHDGDIEFNDVSLILNGRNLLNSLNLYIPKGQILGITGETGAGKSLIASLLTRQLDPNSGYITINDVNIKDISLISLRSHIGLVQQEPFLFSQTVSENIAFGLEEIDQEKIYKAAEIADLMKDIQNFPQGFETTIGERGITLSGGQRQRMAIARIIACQPTILVLDDILSAVDAETEAKILQNLRIIFENKTTIIISHRISTLKHSDRIIVLDQGVVIEDGIHEKLVNLGGIYAKLESKQSVNHINTEEL